jgi:hypothetical protein
MDHRDRAVTTIGDDDPAAAHELVHVTGGVVGSRERGAVDDANCDKEEGERFQELFQRARVSAR